MILYVIPLFVSAIITGGLVFFSGAYRNVPGGRDFRFCLLITSLWSASYAIELLLPTPDTKTIASTLGYISATVLPTTWLATVMKFSGYESQFKRILPYIIIVPALTILLVLTNPLHHLYIQEIHLDEHGPFPILIEDFGPLFWMTVVYEFGLYTISAIYLIKLLAQKSRRHFGQPLTMLIGTLIPLVWNILSTMDGIPSTRLDVTPYLYSISGALLLLGLVYSRLFDVMPVARDIVMDAMCDAVIVIDYKGKVMSVNQAAREVFGWQANQGFILQRFEKVFTEWPEIVELLRAKGEQQIELAMTSDQKQYYYQANLTPLMDAQKNPLGKMLLLHDITASKLVEEELRNLTITDPLTGLGNRRMFFTALENEFERSKRYRTEYCLLMLDLDHYKSINDHYSHLVGDEALKLAARAIQKNARKVDIVARYGGDEFVILLPNTSETGAIQLARRLREAIHNCRISENEYLTVSVGVAVHSPDDPNSEALLARADKALYKAKDEELGIAMAEMAPLKTT